MTPRAVLFDLDGTLYDSGALRSEMLTELLFHTATRGWGTLKRIRALRKQFETLRELGRPVAPLSATRFERAATASGSRYEDVQETFEEWMLRRPGKYLASAMRKDLRASLVRLRKAGLKLGVFSDHPVEAKLRAMGIRDEFDFALSAMDPEINAMKPHPRGIEVACERWGLEPSDIVYVGDREDVDVGVAVAAGSRPVLLAVPGETKHDSVLNFGELADLLLA
jgi:HAD superfamily hydrolase (TIGR01549 family)